MNLTNNFLEFKNVEYYINEINNCEKSLNLLVLNGRSCRHKIDLIENLIVEVSTNIHIIIISETRLKLKEIFNIYGYKSYHSVRQNGDRGGGVSIFIANFLTSSCTYEKNTDSHNFIVVNLLDYNLNICGIYNPGRQFSIFIELFNDILTKYKNIILAGDFNLNIFDQNNLDVSDYVNKLMSNGFVLLNSFDNKFSTRLSSTAIDHVSTDVLNNKYSFCLFDVDPNLSDHRAIILSINKILKEKNTEKIFTLIDYNKIQNTFPSTDLENITSIDDFIRLSQSVLQNNQKTITFSSKNSILKPYITADILNDIKANKKNFLAYKKYPENTFLKEVYLRHRNKLYYKTKQTKIQYYSSRIYNELNNPKKLWQTFNEVMFNTTKKESQKIIHLLYQNNKITDKSVISELFNYYFINIGTLIQNNLPNTSFSFETFMPDPLLNNFQFSPINEQKVLKIIDKINRNASTGLDGITVKYLKEYKHFIAKKLTILINSSIESSIFPEALKNSKVIFIHKSGSTSEVSNYRSISVLNSLSKIYENVIFEQIQEYLRENNIINQNQFGFQPKSSTLTATVNFLNNIYVSLDSGCYTSCIFLDVKKAFDSVPHEILLQKLSFYGMSTSAISFIRSYLTNRTQTACVNDTLSSARTIITGVPQGGILSTILFSLYVNDIFCLKLNGSLQMYADDTVITYKSKNLENLQIQMQNDLEILFEWFASNKLSLNLKKTNFMVFSMSGTYNSIEIKVQNQTIYQVLTSKFLGLMIDYDLKWKTQISQITSKILPYLFALKKSRKFITERAAWSIYNAYIYPHLAYMAPIWGNASERFLNKIKVLQNSCIKIIRKLPPLTPTINLYDIKTLSLKNLIHYETVLLIYKIKHELLKSNVFLQNVNNIHNYNTRQRDNFYINRCRTVLAENNVFYVGLRKFNVLPINLKQANSVSQFKRLLKIYLINN